MFTSAAYVRRLFYLFVAVFIAADVWWLLAWEGERGQVIGEGLFSIGGPAISAVLLYRACRRDETNRSFWLAAFLGVSSNVIASCIWNYYTIWLHIEDPTPSLADLFYIMEISFYLAATICLVTINRGKLRTNRAMLDIFILITIACTVSWQYIIKPTYDMANHELLDIIVTLAYPIGDLGVLFGLLMIYFSASITSLSRPAMLTVTMSFFILILTDSVYMYLSLHDLYTAGSLVDPLYTLSILILGASSLYPPGHKEEKLFTEYEENNVDLRKIIALFVISLAFFSFVISNYLSKIDLFLGGSIVSIILLFIRQFLILKDNYKLTELLAQTKQDLEESNDMLQETVDELQRINVLREHEARTDFLTGLYNRRHMEKLIADAVQDARRTGKECSILLLDLDYFKRINDQYGHDIGDAVLMNVAKLLQASVGSEGHAGRLGGEEFIVLLHDASAAAAVHVAEKVQALLRREPMICSMHSISVTSSIGVTAWQPDESYHALFKRADEYLYEAKRAGRNRIVSDLGVIAAECSL